MPFKKMVANVKGSWRRRRETKRAVSSAELRKSFQGALEEFRKLQERNAKNERALASISAHAMRSMKAPEQLPSTEEKKIVERFMRTAERLRYKNEESRNQLTNRSLDYIVEESARIARITDSEDRKKLHAFTRQVVSWLGHENKKEEAQLAHQRIQQLISRLGETINDSEKANQFFRVFSRIWGKAYNYVTLESHKIEEVAQAKRSSRHGRVQ